MKHALLAHLGVSAIVAAVTSSSLGRAMQPNDEPKGSESKPINAKQLWRAWDGLHEGTRAPTARRFVEMLDAFKGLDLPADSTLVELEKYHANLDGDPEPEWLLHLAVEDPMDERGVLRRNHLVVWLDSSEQGLLEMGSKQVTTLGCSGRGTGIDIKLAPVHSDKVRDIILSYDGIACGAVQYMSTTKTVYTIERGRTEAILDFTGTSVFCILAADGECDEDIRNDETLNWESLKFVGGPPADARVSVNGKWVRTFRFDPRQFRYQGGNAATAEPAPTPASSEKPLETWKQKLAASFPNRAGSRQ
jgi:hypothetical protein